MTQKLIITSQTALMRKYDVTGLSNIQLELNRMIVSDNKKRITTSIHYMDQTRTSRSVFWDRTKENETKKSD